MKKTKKFLCALLSATIALSATAILPTSAKSVNAVSVSASQYNLATPQITKTESTEKGVKLTWNKVNGAYKYRVYYKSNNGWTKFAETSNTSAVDTKVQYGKTYTYTVRCVDKNGKFTSGYNSKGWKHTWKAAPNITKFENVSNGIKISFSKVMGAYKSRLYYKDSKGWHKLADTTGSSFVDTKVKSGKTYTYTVRSLDKNGKLISDYKSGWKQTWIAVPQINKAENKAEGVKLSWTKPEGAYKYRVYYKTSNGWKRLGETTNTSFVDTDVKSGNTYTYTVRCVDKNGNFASSYNGNGFKQTWIAQPEVTKMEVTSNGIKLTWGKCNGAAKYRVYVKTKDGWNRIAETSATSYTHNTQSGSENIYTVRCADSKGKLISSYNSVGWKQSWYAEPKINKLENTSEGVKLTWTAVYGAKTYRVCYKENNQWKTLTETTGTTFIDKKVTSGNNRTYTVMCLDNNGKVASTYDNTGKTQTWIAQPEITSLNATSTGINITWNKVNGAYKYAVYCKENGKWNSFATTTDTKAVYKNVKAGTKYTFTVRCLDKNGNSVSTYNNNGWSISVTVTPEFSNIENVTDGIKLSWNKIDGVAKYRVCYKDNNTWKTLTETTSTSYTDKAVKSGESKLYTLMTLDSNGNVINNYNASGWIQMFVSAPKVTGVEKVENGLTISWKPVTDKNTYTHKYVIYRYDEEWTANKKLEDYAPHTDYYCWRKVGETTDTSFTDTTVEPGKMYYYTVENYVFTYSDSEKRKYVEFYDENDYFFPDDYKWLTAPKEGNSVKLSWTKVSGATSYQVYRKVNGTWKSVGKTTETSFIDVEAKAGNSYEYKIASCDSNGNIMNTSDVFTVSWKVDTPVHSTEMDEYNHTFVNMCWGCGEDITEWLNVVLNQFGEQTDFTHDWDHEKQGIGSGYHDEYVMKPVAKHTVVVPAQGHFELSNS